MEKRIYLASPKADGNEFNYVKEAFKTNWLAPLGPFVERLESEFKKYMNIEGTTALSSGTSAIHLALKLAGVKKGDYVFVSTLTFSASVNPIIYEGGIPVFIDSDESLNMSPKALREAFKKYKPKAVILVHLYGLSTNVDEIVEICKENNTILIEDAAEALGSTYNNKKLGTFGKYGIISFNGNKIITTTGGGMLLTHTEEEAKKALFWATQSRENKKYYEHKELGYNYRLSNVSAAIGCGQLENIDKKINKKREIHDYYKEKLKNVKEIEIVDENSNLHSNYWLTIGIIKSNKVKPIDLINKLEENNIESRHIWNPMHNQPFFKEYDYIKDNGYSDEIFNTGICLPSDVNMTKKEQNEVIRIIKELFK